VIESREVLEENYKKFETLFEQSPIMRPLNWGGYIVKPSSIEFWQGRKSRLHDRFLFQTANDQWYFIRLAP
jgi:pyridoxamine 5'-phosphate oxidase